MKEFEAGAALVVGGSGGIGSAIARCIAQHGSAVAITYRTQKDAAEKLAKDCAALGVKASAHLLDLNDEKSVDAAWQSALKEHGTIHSVIHAAGSAIEQPYISELNTKQLENVLNADVLGFFRVVSCALPTFRQNKGGSFVFISSAGLQRYPVGDILSVAPKAAAETIVKGIAREEGRNNIRANSIGIGVAEAGMFQRLVASEELNQEWITAAKKNIPLRRFGVAAEIAEAAVFLASNRASYVTGQSLQVDGGYSV